MNLKRVDAKIVRDSRKEKTIEVSLKTEFGLFSSSSPSGKSKGKWEKPYYIKDIKQDITTIKNFSDEICNLEIENFSDLKKVEDLLRGKIGSNTFFALETCLLKSLATWKGVELWQVINKNAKKFPFPVGNCIGGGLHTKSVRGKKPDFQEFLFVPKTNNFSDNVFLMKKAWKILGQELRLRKARGERNDENALSTSLSNEEVLEIMKKVKEELENETGKEISIGVDIAASSFYSRGFYLYKNKKRKLNKEKQISFILDLIDKYNLDYIEDPLQEEDFSGFARLKKEVIKVRPTCLVVGDDLTVSNLERFKKAIKEKSINAIILKPNQIGSLIEISEIAKLAKKLGIKTIMSHRSGETLDYSLADFAFAFQTDYIKTGVMGKERDIKLKRLIDIENSLS